MNKNIMEKFNKKLKEEASKKTIQYMETKPRNNEQYTANFLEEENKINKQKETKIKYEELKRKYEEAQKEEEMILEELGKIEKGIKPSRELENRNLISEAKLKEIKDELEKIENSLQKEEGYAPEEMINKKNLTTEKEQPENIKNITFSAGDVVELEVDGDKITKIENSDEKEINNTETKTEEWENKNTEESLKNDILENTTEEEIPIPMPKEKEVEDIIKQIEQEDEENKTQKQKEEDFFNDQKKINREVKHEIKETMLDREEIEKASKKLLNDIYEHDSREKIKKGEYFSAGDVVELEVDGDKITKIENSDEKEINNTETKTEEWENKNTEESLKNDILENTTEEEIPIPMPKENQSENKMDTEKERASVFIKPTNKNLWNKLSSGAKGVISKAYEGLYKTPVANRIVGKIEISYNQFFIDRNEKKKINLASKLESLHIKSEALEMRRDFQNEMNGYFGEIEPNSKIEFEDKRINREQEKIDNKQNKIISKIDIKEKRMEIFTNKRDAIVDRLLLSYDKKLSPITGKMEALESEKNRIESICANAESLIKKQEDMLKELELKRNESRKRLSIFYSEKDINRNPIIKELENQISQTYSSIYSKKFEINEEKNRINKKILKKTKKIEPYMNRRNALERIKERKPIDINFEVGNTKYKEGEGYSENEKQNETINKNIENKNTYIEKPGTMASKIEEYTKLLGENKEDPTLNITKEDFTRITGIPEKNPIKNNDFKDIIISIYKIRRVPESKYINIINKI